MSEKVSRLASSYFDQYACPLFSLAPQDKIGGKSTCYYAVAAWVAVETVLPLWEFDIEIAIELVRWIQGRKSPRLFITPGQKEWRQLLTCKRRCKVRRGKAATVKSQLFRRAIFRAHSHNWLFTSAGTENKT
ncbi:MAG: hypothetical protein MUO63_00530 [Desulfobulbaceae bacterium]|nr:hypothetical protein [Desulfobulbaceae bacterium]